MNNFQNGKYCSWFKEISARAVHTCVVATGKVYKYLFLYVYLYIKSSAVCAESIKCNVISLLINQTTCEKAKENKCIDLVSNQLDRNVRRDENLFHIVSAVLSISFANTWSLRQTSVVPNGLGFPQRKGAKALICTACAFCFRCTSRNRYPYPPMKTYSKATALSRLHRVFSFSFPTSLRCVIVPLVYNTFSCTRTCTYSLLRTLWHTKSHSSLSLWRFWAFEVLADACNLNYLLCMCARICGRLSFVVWPNAASPIHPFGIMFCRSQMKSTVIIVSVEAHFVNATVSSHTWIVIHSKTNSIVHFGKVEIEGLTGDIRFNEDGRRENYTLSVVEMSSNSDMIKIAEWSDRTHLTPNGKRLERVPPRIDFERNRTYIVTTILEEPYIMLKKPKMGETIDEHDKYIGYCKDLADILAKRLGINCKWVKCGVQSTFTCRIKF